MYIETKRCIVRDMSMDDADDLYEVLSDKEVMKYIEKPFTLEETKDFINKAGIIESPLVYSIVWKENGKMIGHVIFHQYERDEFEIGWILNKKYWHQGIACELTESYIEYATVNKISKLVIECVPEQEKTIQLALKHNFLFCECMNGCNVYKLSL